MIIPAKLCGLVVEDNDYSRALAVASLKKIGIGAVIQAVDGIDGIALLNSQSVDFILLDWYMPDMNGGGFIRLVRDGHVACSKNIPIIVTTAFAAKENIRRIRELGIKEILIKPFDNNQLTAALGQALQKIETELAAPPAEDVKEQFLL